MEALPIAKAAATGVTIQPLMVGEVGEVLVDLVTVSGSETHVEPARHDEAVVFLLVAGNGTMQAKGNSYAVSGETIARAPQGWDWQITAHAGNAMQLVRIRRKLTAVDFEELAKFPEFQKEPLVKAFKDCTPYGEAIKSPKTVSRTLLPENYVPRMAMGTVETTGPDAVGAHRHAMLEQLFLGLKGNEITVTADEERATLEEFTILHIPLGSFHGAQVREGKKLHYVWMDFFADKAGQEWLKTHKPLTTPNTP
ncbi:MAG: cupin domain-containing protein [Bryobacterales bacterium]|nr:cupin domain-containing protein [Bryobacterales bacterium]